MPVPFLGRLAITEYVAVIGSFIFVGLEVIIRALTFALPSPLISLCYRASRRLFNKWEAGSHKKESQRKNEVSKSIRNATDFVELCELFGYTAEEHVVQTGDGYLLGVHRLAWKRGEEDTRVNSGPSSVQKRVIYMHHGLLMNSEVWVCLTDAQKVLPFVLVERGFDVWLGNNRGNKYSKKSVRSTSTSLEFWDFSIDEFAFHDIPNSIQYILSSTGQPSLSYIGFSQGTAQAFAALSIHPKLNQQVNVFIALAPAMSPPGLANGIADALIKASPQVLFLMFGRRSILSSAPLWESLVYPPLYIKILDMGMKFLFNWKGNNIAQAQKLAAYPHLYSFTSTKSVVHWFQIIRTKSFQMFDDDPPLTIGTNSRFTKVARYPTRNIKTPIVLVYGGSDSLVDIKAMLRELPPTTVATEIPHYEHLDFLWAKDVAAQVFPHVFDALDSFTDAEHTKDEFDSYRRARHQSLNRSNTFWRNARSQNGSDVNASDVDSVVGSAMKLPHQAREGVIRNPQYSDDDSYVTETSEPGGGSPKLLHPNRASLSVGLDVAHNRRGSSGSLSSKTSGTTKRSLHTGKGISFGKVASADVSTTDVTGIATASPQQASTDDGGARDRLRMVSGQR
ncbi:triacylglycerol lipase [Diaporthe helianthi]|uniref:Triacylglycerol lipase n=1 Tax=Diaporthe helianthi TaxID=158607 RepID=A0A2P5HGM3_DIAHE|nr:triacylglycerol lipase [Diaporthe helianthi]